jgi:hypothetical protein
MPGNPFTDPNWAADLADTVERVVGGVRDKTTKPLVKAARAIVYGLFAGILGITAVVLLLIIATRAIEALFDIGLDHDQAVYLSYLTIGGILCLGGLLIMKRRSSN